MTDEASNGSDLDHRLKQLAIAAQAQPPGSAGRRRALHQLIVGLQQSRRLARPRMGFSGFYNDIYADALQRLFCFICDRIDHYDPHRGEVLQWVNYRLTRQFIIEASREYFPTLPKGIDPRTVQRMTLEDLDRNNPDEVNPQLVPLPSQLVQQCLEEDPDGRFRQTCVERHPEANFQAIALWRLAGYSWEEISANLKIRVPTLSTFYQRSIKKFAPYIKDYVS